MYHIDEFNEAWNNPQFIQIELEPVNINDALRSHYSNLSGFVMTKAD